MGLAKDGRIVVGDVVRMRGRPEQVVNVIEETARSNTRRVRITIPRDPGQAGIAQQADFVRRLDRFILDFSPETGDKATRAKPFAVQVNNHKVEMIEGGWNSAFREELRAFPNGRWDDQVDAASRAHMVLTSGKPPLRINPANVAGQFGASTTGARLPTSYGASDVTTWRASFSSAYEPWRGPVR